jgi:uncharacterized protein YraI
MSTKHWLICVLAAALPLAAAAQEAHSVKWVNLRAGPSRDYPLVVRVGPGAPLIVQGCTDGFGWCDVVGPGDVRGWVFAGNIAYPYQNSQVPIITYGAVIGFPIVTFVIGDYWGRYYRGRPFYASMPRWAARPLPPRPGFRPGPPGFRPGPPPRPIVRPPAVVRPPVVRPPVGGGRPPGAGGGGGRPPGAGGPGGGRPPGAGGPGGGRPPGAGGPGGGGRPEGGRPGGGGRPEGGGRGEGR